MGRWKCRKGWCKIDASDETKNGSRPPALVIGLPVGFVNAAESKAALLDLDIPYITNVGRKGGSNVAASVVNALILLALEDHVK